MENEAIILNVPNKELGFFKASLGSIDLKRTDYSVFYKNMGDYSQVSIFSRHPSIQLELQNEIFLNGAFKSWYDLRENESSVKMLLDKIVKEIKTEKEVAIKISGLKKNEAEVVEKVFVTKEANENKTGFYPVRMTLLVDKKGDLCMIIKGHKKEKVFT